MAGLVQIQQIDIDELAREKVQEVEKLLDSAENHKLDAINSWLSVLKQIITAADLHRTNDKNNPEGVTTKAETDDSIYADYADDNEQFNTVDLTEQFATNSVKWTIRVKAFKLVHRLVHMSSNLNRPSLSKSPILKHLPDLVRLSFVAATSPYDDLKIQGFEMFKFLINRFASIEEREFPGHSILEQYRTQVLSALKPAFNLDAPPYITAIASQVCCLWICRGLERDSSNLMRTYQLMMVTINKLENQSVNQNSKLYTESELEQERLDILGSWAQLYIAAKESGEGNSSESNRVSNLSRFNYRYLYELVQPQVGSLIDKWWEALKDYALLIIPAPKIIGTSHDSEHVYTREVALRLFDPVWPKLILASTIWLCSDESLASDKNSNHIADPGQLPVPLEVDSSYQICDNPYKNQYRTSKTKYFKFICGILMKELCKCHSDDKTQADSLSESTTFAIRSLSILVNNDEMKSALVDELVIAQEFYTILYSILINRTKARSQHHMILKNLIDLIFNLVVTKVAKNPENVRYGVAHLVDWIKRDLKSIEDAVKADKTSELETLKANLFIRVCNAITIIRLQSKLITDEIPLRDCLAVTFKEILSFKADLSLGTSLLDLLKDLYIVMPQEYASFFIVGLFNFKTNMVSYLFSSMLNTEESPDKDKMISSIPYLEAYLKAVRTSVELANVNDRRKLISTFLKTLLETLPRTQETGSTQITSRKKDLLDLGIKCIDDTGKTYPNEFIDVLTPEMKKIFDSALKLQQDIKTESEAKRNAQVAKKPTSIIGGSTKPQTKIILKADFSNFYAKKS